MIEINISLNKKYRTQRDNQLKPLGTCNTTAMCMALQYSGFQLPDTPYNQYEDALTNFLLTDPKVLEYYEQLDPGSYKAWKTNPDSPVVFPPNEYHNVLSFGTNLWMKKQVTKFSTTTPMQDILFDILKGRATAVSGVWAKLHHIVCVVGFSTLQDTIRDATDPAQIDTEKMLYMIIDDPYGNYKTDYKDSSGNDIYVPFSDYIAITKTQGSITKKWTHRIVL